MAVALTAGAVQAGPASAAVSPSQSGSWSSLVNLPNTVAINMAVSPTGDVLMWDRSSPLSYPKRWNPATGTLVAVPAVGNSLFCSFQVQLADGRLAVIGGTSPTGGEGGISQMRLFDYTTNSWANSAEMHTPRWYPTAVELPDGRIFVYGGHVKPGTLANVPEVYDPATSAWTELPDLAEGKAPGLYPRALLAPNGQVFVVRNAAGKSAYFDIDTQRSTVVAAAPTVVALSGFVSYDTGKYLLVGAGATKKDTFAIDLTAAKPAWRKVGALHAPHQKDSTVVLPTGQVMAIGGSTDGTQATDKAVLAPEIWDPVTEAWSLMPDLNVPRMYHSSAVVLPDGRVFAAGGGRVAGGTNYMSGETFSFDWLTAPDRPSITGALPTAWVPGAPITISTDAPNGVDRVVMLALGAVTHSIDTKQRRLTLPITTAYDPTTHTVGVTAPNLLNAPPGDYMVMVLDPTGKSSTGTIVRVIPATPNAPLATTVATASSTSVPRTVADPATSLQDGQ